MKDLKHLDDYMEFHSNCACGCGQEATQIYRGIPIPSVNPMQHYRAYLKKTFSLRNMLDIREGAGYT
jgi:hypothetical protein